MPDNRPRSNLALDIADPSMAGSPSVARRRRRLQRQYAHAAAARDRAGARLDELLAELERLDGPETAA
jgi:hypothetical protein